MRFLLLLTVLLVATAPLAAQPLADSFSAMESEAPQYSFYGEVLGNGLGLSVSAEHFVFDQISVRVGLGVLPLWGLIATAPVTVNWVGGSGTCRPEVGVGVTAMVGVYEIQPEEHVLAASFVGVRCLSLPGPSFTRFGVAVYPINWLSIEQRVGVVPSIGFGYRF